MTHYHKRKIDWQQDLSLGEWAENIILDWLRPIMKKKHYEFTKFNKDKGWDLEFQKYEGINPVKDDKLLFEVKTDVYTTNRIFVETHSNNRKSGIQTTKAHFWIFFLIEKDFYNNNILIVDTDTLREVCKASLRSDANFGSTTGYLVNFNDFKKEIRQFRYDSYNFDYERYNMKKTAVQGKTTYQGKLDNKNPWQDFEP